MSTNKIFFEFLIAMPKSTCQKNIGIWCSVGVNVRKTSVSNDFPQTKVINRYIPKNEYFVSNYE